MLVVELGEARKPQPSALHFTPGKRPPERHQEIPAAVLAPPRVPDHSLQHPFGQQRHVVEEIDMPPQPRRAEAPRDEHFRGRDTLRRDQPIPPQRRQDLLHPTELCVLLHQAIPVRQPGPERHRIEVHDVARKPEPYRSLDHQALQVDRRLPGRSTVLDPGEMHRPDRCLDEGQGIRRVRTAEKHPVVPHRYRETARHPRDLPLELGKLDLLERDGRAARIVPALDTDRRAGECRPRIELDPSPRALDGTAPRRIEALQEAESERMLGPLHRIAPARLTEGEEGLEVRDATAVVPYHEALCLRLVREIHARGAGAPRVLQELRDDGVPVRKGEPEVLDEAPLVQADCYCFGHAYLHD